MLKHITYSSGNMDISASLASKSALKYGADTSIVYTPADIDEKYVYDYGHIFKHERGAGYWLWKPYIIHKSLLLADKGDFILYTDAGVEIINDLSILTALDQDILLFRNMYQHEQWCKMDTMYAINGRRSMPIKQCQASAMMLKVGEKSRMFVLQWLVWCEIEKHIDDSPSIMKNHPEFKEHRHDQAILTCLAYRNNIKTWWWPAQYNNGQFIYDDGMNDRPYPVIFHHHRKRDNEWQ